jgi:cytochrome P450 family 6
MLAGGDTSSSVISYALTELGHHPEIQQKLRKEIIDKTESSNSEITYDNLHEMSYLNQVVNGKLFCIQNSENRKEMLLFFIETLRKFPPAFTIARQANRDFKVPDTKNVIKKGVQVMIPSLSIHYDERYWNKPQKFNPDRFSADFLPIFCRFSCNNHQKLQCQTGHKQNETATAIRSQNSRFKSERWLLGDI